MASVRGEWEGWGGRRGGEREGGRWRWRRDGKFRCGSGVVLGRQMCFHALEMDDVLTLPSRHVTTPLTPYTTATPRNFFPIFTLIFIDPPLFPIVKHRAKRSFLPVLAINSSFFVLFRCETRYPVVPTRRETDNGTQTPHLAQLIDATGKNLPCATNPTNTELRLKERCRW